MMTQTARAALERKWLLVGTSLLHGMQLAKQNSRVKASVHMDLETEYWAKKHTKNHQTEVNDASFLSGKVERERERELPTCTSSYKKFQPFSHCWRSGKLRSPQEAGGREGGRRADC